MSYPESRRIALFLEKYFERAEEALLEALAYMSGLLGEMSAEKLERSMCGFLESLPHVLIHEAAHAYAEELAEIPGASVEGRALLEEVLAHFIERKTSELLKRHGYSWVLVESFEEQVREIEEDPDFGGVKIPVELYAMLYRGFEESLEKGELASFVRVLAEKLGASSSPRYP